MIYVNDIMTHNVRTIASEATVFDAAKAMARWKIGSLIILRRKSPIGIITEVDISKYVAKGLDPRSTPVLYRKKNLVTVEPGERLEVAAKLMAEAGVKKLPVLEGGKLVGIVTQTDIVNSSFALVTSLKEMVQARYRPPDFQV
jgi:tRNA nucleotidyltransferase (CCA-adding enzyme)